MKIARTEIEGVLLLRPSKHADARGFVAETFRADALAEMGVTHNWAQDNHAYTARRGCIRGLHFQRGAAAQAKLVRVLRGAVFDVAVDLREGSPTRGQHIACELDAEAMTQIYIPAGFAHGFQALTDGAEVLYRLSAPYAPESEGGVLWRDPALAIAWPLPPIDIAPRDEAWPLLQTLL